MAVWAVHFRDRYLAVKACGTARSKAQPPAAGAQSLSAGYAALPPTPHGRPRRRKPVLMVALHVSRCDGGQQVRHRGIIDQAIEAVDPSRITCANIGFTSAIT
jgi:hypothetical protein